MGKVTDSFKREIGKNTGKVISNMLFGDSHSTPYRRVYSRERLELQRADTESKAEARKERNKILKEKTKADSAKSRRGELNNLDAAVLSAIEKLNAQPIPDSAPELIEFMSKLAVQLQATPFNQIKGDGAIHNKFLYALVEKYTQGLFMLQTIAPSSPHIAYYEKALNQKKNAIKWAKIKYFSRNHPIIVGIAFLAVLFVAANAGPGVSLLLIVILLTIILIPGIKVIRS